MGYLPHLRREKPRRSTTTKRYTETDVRNSSPDSVSEIRDIKHRRVRAVSPDHASL